MKVRIFALAKELGMDSKELFEHAAEAGVKVKNNALASVSEAERDVILAHIGGESGGGKAAKKAAKKDAEKSKPAPAAPVRPQRTTETKVRTVGGAPQRQRPVEVAAEEVAPEPEQTTPKPEPEPPAPEQEPEPEPEVVAESPAEPEPSAPPKAEASPAPKTPQTRAEQIAAMKMKPVRPVSGGGRPVRTLGAGAPSKPAAKPAQATPAAPTVATPVAKPAAPASKP
ncbi:translation initiation factor IF-2 N-terminal domain-containing protein, partial [Alienimonas chondri]|uniref:translation initiation factor IF-2 N-terminal domain-containing protein n=1 Tax=Alienimonas chondri TaxID=2681879 RepID=UPI00148A0605